MPTVLAPRAPFSPTSSAVVSKTTAMSSRTFRSLANGDIVPVQADGTKPRGRRKARGRVLPLKAVENMRPKRDKIITATGVRLRTCGVQLWGWRSLGKFADRGQRASHMAASRPRPSARPPASPAASAMRRAARRMPAQGAGADLRPRAGRSASPAAPQDARRRVNSTPPGAPPVCARSAVPRTMAAGPGVRPVRCSSPTAGQPKAGAERRTATARPYR